MSALTSLVSIVVIWSDGESTGFDATAILFWISGMLNLAGAISEKTWIRGAVAATEFAFTMISSLTLFTNEMI